MRTMELAGLSTEQVAALNCLLQRAYDEAREATESEIAKEEAALAVRGLTYSSAWRSIRLKKASIALISLGRMNAVEIVDEVLKKCGQAWTPEIAGAVRSFMMAWTKEASRSLDAGYRSEKARATSPAMVRGLSLSQGETHRRLCNKVLIDLHRDLTIKYGLSEASVPAKDGAIINVYGGLSMPYFDQRGQEVTNQYNAAGNISIGAVLDKEDLVLALGKMLRDISDAKDSGAIDEQSAAAAENHLRQAETEAKRDKPDKSRLLKHASEAATLIQVMAAASALPQNLHNLVHLIQSCHI